MLFNSLTFLIFFAAVLLLHYILPHKFRWVMLLFASYLFYMAWRPELIILLLFLAAVNYGVALKINGREREKARKALLVLSIVINFTVLFVFKYLVFINHSFRFVYEYFGLSYPIADFDIILPMGISFYTFQAASYTIDVYRRVTPPQRNFFKFSLFITFFPQLVAGPIERSNHLMPSLFQERRFDVSNVSIGLKIMLLGFFKKVVIADRVAAAVNTVYNAPGHFDGVAYTVATLLFAFQIYCDFSGYSDIALGCAKTLGIDLTQNFRSPYYAASIKEFWQRWHITLSTWFRDYVYIPLGGNRVTKSRNYANLMAAFLLSGMWHGANWTFFIWGFLHGLFQVAGHIRQSIFPRRWDRVWPVRMFYVIITFALVCFAWIFFRANTVQDAFYIVTRLSTGFENAGTPQYWYVLLNNMGLSLFELLIGVCCVIFLLLIEWFEQKETVHTRLNRAPFVFRFAFYYGIVLVILCCGVFGNASEFIYFQF